MSDERLRELERRWQETGADADEGPFLLEQVRLGRLSRAQLELAASLDHPAARLALGDAAPPQEPEPSLLARWLRRTEHEVRGRLVGWPSGTAFELSEWVRQLEAHGDDVVLEAGRVLGRMLGEDWPRLRRAVEAFRPPTGDDEPRSPLDATIEVVRIAVETREPEAAREHVRAGLVQWALDRSARPAPVPARAGPPRQDPISNLADDWIDQARELGEAEGGGQVDVRLRLDPVSNQVRGEAHIGTLAQRAQRVIPVPPSVLDSLIARFKYMVGLDPFETEAPQAGQGRVPQGELSVETYRVEEREACRVVVR